MNSIPHFRFVHRTGNLTTLLSLLAPVTGLVSCTLFR